MTSIEPSQSYVEVWARHGEALNLVLRAIERWFASAHFPSNAVVTRDRSDVPSLNIRWGEADDVLRSVEITIDGYQGGGGVDWYWANIAGGAWVDVQSTVRMDETVQSGKTRIWRYEVLFDHVSILAIHFEKHLPDPEVVTMREDFKRAVRAARKRVSSWTRADLDRTTLLPPVDAFTAEGI
jgi:hypothetical protein